MNADKRKCPSHWTESPGFGYRHEGTKARRHEGLRIGGLPLLGAIFPISIDPSGNDDAFGRQLMIQDRPFRATAPYASPLRAFVPPCLRAYPNSYRSRSQQCRAWLHFQKANP